MVSSPTVQAPDPVATAAAQTASNQQTAKSQTELNSINQVTPDGSLTYTQNGTYADGTPKFTATTALSGSNQNIYDTGQVTKQNLAELGSTQSAKLNTLLGTPFSVDNSIADKITSLGKQRLDPQWQANQTAFDAQMANQGIQPGSEAYNNAYKNFSQSKNDAYNSLYLNGDQQAEQESIAQRNQPINEITALMSGSQVSQPSFTNTPTTQVAGTDVAGITQSAFGDNMQNAQMQNSTNNAMMGGLFGLAGAGVTGGATLMKPAPVTNIYSDRRLKTDVRRVGKLDNGLPVYSYRYIGHDAMQIGVMADEVERLHPDAVTHDARGFKMVDYAQAVGA